jgi:hypothetical protein
MVAIRMWEIEAQEGMISGPCGLNVPGLPVFLQNSHVRLH